MTRALLAAGARVTAIERDRRCIPPLDELTAFYPGRLRVIEGDALDIDARSLFEGTPAILANLPYNVAPALFVRSLSADCRPWLRSPPVMFPSDVAVPFLAAPDTSAYGPRAPRPPRRD